MTQTLVFGLTGGVASGKSTVAGVFRDEGVVVVDADQLAREVVAVGTEGYAAVVEAFGAEVVGADGALDRARLGALVFASPGRRQQLNAIVHPRIAMRTQQRLAELRAQGVPLVCYDAALLVENGLQDAFRPLVVVSAPEDVQRRRGAIRDGVDPEVVEAKIKAQLPLADKVAVADFVIDNSGSLEALRDRCRDVLARIRAHAGQEPA